MNEYSGFFWFIVSHTLSENKRNERTRDKRDAERTI